jgi:hypothetical protein
MHGECGLTAILPHLLQIKEAGGRSKGRSPGFSGAEQAGGFSDEHTTKVSFHAPGSSPAAVLGR